jgi:hypothetical protein
VQYEARGSESDRQQPPAGQMRDWAIPMPRAAADAKEPPHTQS